MKQETLQLANELSREITSKNESYDDLKKSLNGLESNMMYLQIRCFYKDSAASGYELNIPEHLQTKLIKDSIVCYQEEISKIEKQLEEL